MTDLLITEATKQGLWAILYITLYFYTLREGRRQQTISATREDQLRDEASMLRKECLDREAKLTNFIDNMAKQFERLATQYERIAADVQEIRVDLEHKVDRTELK
ncbi:BhlA/UviB family holin-like peptide [Sporolactobacillus terrae]|uniref:BhlA/UviB family holin-like peptide n=1 Tax=Sporolactobacillus terrae TaxID=269673 RepID=UPI00048AA79B|nr:BhlA/UviB family holin-like peptide [Sporolactobacillus terrae]